MRNHPIYINPLITLPALFLLLRVVLILCRHRGEPGFIPEVRKVEVLVLLRFSFELGVLLRVFIDQLLLEVVAGWLGLTELRSPDRFLRLVVIIFVGLVNFKGLF